MDKIFVRQNRNAFVVEGGRYDEVIILVSIFTIANSLTHAFNN